MHAPYQFPTGEEAEKISIDPLSKNFIIYTKKTIKLLPPPYATNCRNYTVSGFQSQKDCLYEC